MGYKIPDQINPRDMKMVGDVIVNTSIIDLRELQEYLRFTYGVELIIHTPAFEPPTYPAGCAAPKGE